MAIQPYEFLWIVKESAYGTQKTSPVAGTDSHYIRLAGPNRFTMRPKPTMRKIKYGGGYDIPGYAVSDQYLIMGNLEFELCYSHFTMLAQWATNRINAGQTTPWTTTEPSGDMASCTVYHAITTDTGTIRRKRYRGVKVHGGSIKCDTSTGLAMMSLSLQAQKMDANTPDGSSDPDATAFPAPADTAFPTDPLLMSHLTATINSSSLTYLQSLNLSWTNVSDARFFGSSKFIAFDRMRGRQARAEHTVLYTASPNWRSAFEAVTSYAASYAWTNGANTATVTYNASNLVDAVDDDLTPGKLFDQKLILENQYDTSASADIASSYA